MVKGLVQELWRDNSIPSSNQKDVLKLRMGSRDREPHIKHFLDMTQIELYERFRHEHDELNLGQRAFEKCKPWYVKINTTRNTCFCRYHIEYGYYYDTYIHILHVFNNTLVQEFSTTFPLTSSRDFIHSILCRRTEGCTFDQRPCIVGTCPTCGGMEFLDKCIHVTDEHELGRNELKLQSFKYVTYDIDGGNERKKYNWPPLRLVTSS